MILAMVHGLILILREGSALSGMLTKKFMGCEGDTQDYKARVSGRKGDRSPTGGMVMSTARLGRFLPAGISSNTQPCPSSLYSPPGGWGCARWGP